MSRLKNHRGDVDISIVRLRATRFPSRARAISPKRRPHRAERGAAAVEFAIVATLLIPIVAGIIDYGTLFQKRQAVQDATRAGARVGASTCAVISGSPISPNCDAGNLLDHDAKIMQALRARLGSSVDQVTRIVVYRSVALDSDSTPLNGRMIKACDEKAPPDGIVDFCNIYGPNELALVDTLSDAALAARFSCADLAQYWCSTTRERARRAADAYIGVQVELKHPHVVRFFGSDENIVYRSVFRLDPNSAIPDRPRPLPVPPPPSTTTTIPPPTTTTIPPPTTTTTTTIGPPTTTTIPPPTTTEAPTTTTTEAPTTTVTTLPPPSTTTTTSPPTTTTTPPPTTTTTPPPPTTTTTPPPTTTTTPPPTTTTTTTTRAPRPCC